MNIYGKMTTYKVMILYNVIFFSTLNLTSSAFITCKISMLSACPLNEKEMYINHKNHLTGNAFCVMLAICVKIKMNN